MFLSCCKPRKMKVTTGLNADRLRRALKDGLKKEEKCQANLKCLSARKDSDEISFSHRDKSVALLLQLNRHCNFHPEVFALAVNLLDRFLSVMKARPKYLPCISVSCLFLAVKMVEEDEAIPNAKDLIEVSGLSCSSSDLLRMERIVLDKLGWDLNPATPLQFLQVFHALCVSEGFLDHCPVTQHLHHITLRLEELLCNHKFLVYKPSTLALALISHELSLMTNDWVKATLVLQDEAKLPDSEVSFCSMLIHDHFRMTIAYQHQMFITNLPISVALEVDGKGAEDNNFVDEQFTGFLNHTIESRA